MHLTPLIAQLAKLKAENMCKVERVAAGCCQGFGFPYAPLAFVKMSQLFHLKFFMVIG